KLLGHEAVHSLQERSVASRRRDGAGSVRPTSELVGERPTFSARQEAKLPQRAREMVVELRRRRALEGGEVPRDVFEVRHGRAQRRAGDDSGESARREAGQRVWCQTAQRGPNRVMGTVTLSTDTWLMIIDPDPRLLPAGGATLIR